MPLKRKGIMILSDFAKTSASAVGAPQDRHDSRSSYSCNRYAFLCLDDLSKIVPLSLSPFFHTSKFTPRNSHLEIFNWDHKDRLNNCYKNI